MSTNQQWWNDALIYQIYPRSFSDSNGDGIGDIRGAIGHLAELADLGVDAIWMSPWNPSPGVDGGYDVSDYTDIAPEFGTLDDAREFVATAHELGIRVLMDLVANHSSDQHRWFLEALAAAPGSPERERYYFRDGRGVDGELPPNNWVSGFGSSAWTRTTNPDGTPGQWYLHTFAPQQPDLNWTNPLVQQEFDRIMQFWFDLGIDGFRVDALPAAWKVEGLPDADYDPSLGFATKTWSNSPHWDVEGVHDLVRRWRRLGDSCPEPKFFIGECVVSTPERLAAYVRPDEMQGCFNFDFLYAGWDADRMRAAIDATLATHASVGAVPSWVLGSHDEVRLATRFGRSDSRAGVFAQDEGDLGDVVIGPQRALAAIMLELALPGNVTLYQGDELALPEVLDLTPEQLRHDPVYERSGGTRRGRTGCRIPLPWTREGISLGFGDVEGWLPQPDGWSDLSREAQAADPSSSLNLVRSAVQLRRQLASLRNDVSMVWLEAPPHVLRVGRGEDFECITVMGDEPYPLPEGAELLLGSRPLADGAVPANATVWVRV